MVRTRSQLRIGDGGGSDRSTGAVLAAATAIAAGARSLSDNLVRIQTDVRHARSNVQRLSQPRAGGGPSAARAAPPPRYASTARSQPHFRPGPLLRYANPPRRSRRGKFTGNTMTKYDRMRGKKGKRGSIRRKVSKKLKRSNRKKYTRTIVQTYYMCPTDRLDQTDQLFDILMRAKRVSTEAVDAKHSSIVVFSINNTEAHWDPLKYRIGNQLLNSQVPGGPKFEFHNDINNGTTLVANDSIYTLNNYPETATPANILQSVQVETFPPVVPEEVADVAVSKYPTTYTIPNSILSGIKITLQIDADRPYPQVFAIKVLRASTPIPVKTGKFASTAAEAVAVTQEICNRAMNTNGKVFTTLWNYRSTLPAVRCGQRPKFLNINKSIKIDLPRSSWRKHSSAADQDTIGTQALPSFEYADDGFYHQVYIVMQTYPKDDHYMADVHFATATNVIVQPSGDSQYVNNTFEQMPVRKALKFNPIQNPLYPVNNYDEGNGYARFRYGGKITVFHKVKETTRGWDLSVADQISKINSKIENMQFDTLEETKSEDEAEAIDLETGGRMHIAVPDLSASL